MDHRVLTTNRGMFDAQVSRFAGEYRVISWDVPGHGAFSCPVLLVVGENDRSGKVTSYCRRWSEEEGHELIFLPDAAHNSNVDNPAAFNETLQTFLQRFGQSGPGRDR